MNNGFISSWINNIFMTHIRNNSFDGGTIHCKSAGQGMSEGVVLVS
jgi:hypothetical protein